MKVFNMFSFILLFVASILSFLLIFGAGFVGDLNYKLFLIIGIFAALWAITYIWPLSFKESKNKVLFILSGTIIVYNILLSTLFLDPTAIQNGWIFIGTPVVMIVIWYFLLYRVIRKNASTHWFVWIVYIGIVLCYAWDITSFYNTNVIS